MLQSKLSPSLMCADLMNLGRELKILEQNGIEYLHLDVMDGDFVPNYMLGTDFVKRVKEASTIPLDLHLMVTNPEEKLSWFAFGEGDYVSFHYEASGDPMRGIREIRERGAKPMLAIRPLTPIWVLDEFLPLLDGVLIMTVQPGFAGQKMIPETLDKIRELRQQLDATGREAVEIECDGNVSFENARKMREAGANLFVVGSSGIYAKDNSVEENVKILRRNIL
jgi:ribulose-phosphate 3-epimerase